MADIFKFWSQIGPKETIHPADVPIFARLKGQHAFDLKCLPLGFSGPLRTARVVLLYLSPGLSARDREYAKIAKWQQLYTQQRTGRYDLPNDPETLGYRWKKARLAFLGDWEKSLGKIAIFNIGGYHSKNFNDHDILASLPSSRIALDWAQSVLFPEAEAGKRVVICMRAARYWGLRTGQRYGKSLFAPETTIGGHMIKGPVRDKVTQAARAALG